MTLFGIIVALTCGFIGGLFATHLRQSDRMLTLMKWVPNWLLYYAVITAWARITTTEGFTHLEPTSVTFDTVCKFLEGKD